MIPNPEVCRERFEVAIKGGALGLSAIHSTQSEEAMRSVVSHAGYGSWNEVHNTALTLSIMKVRAWIAYNTCGVKMYTY